MHGFFWDSESLTAGKKLSAHFYIDFSMSCKQGINIQTLYMKQYDSQREEEVSLGVTLCPLTSAVTESWAEGGRFYWQSFDCLTFWNSKRLALMSWIH